MKKLKLIACAAVLLLCGGCGRVTGDVPGLKACVFYYTYADVYISGVRANMDERLEALGIAHQNYDGSGNQTIQSEQISTAVTDDTDILIVNIVETSSDEAAMSAVEAARRYDIPVIFFNREVSDAVVESYDKCVFVGTDAAESGHIQGEMIGNYLLENYEETDINGDGVISYVLFKGQEGNAEAEYRTRYSVEDCNRILKENGLPELKFYDANNSSGYLLDQSGQWSAAAANNYMDTVLSEYSESNGNMVELVIANNDAMAAGAISSLQTAGYNNGTGTDIPVFGVDAVANARHLISQGRMAGSVSQDAEAMADTIAGLAENTAAGRDIMWGTEDMNIDRGVRKIRVPYGIVTR